MTQSNTNDPTRNVARKKRIVQIGIQIELDDSPLEVSDDQTDVGKANHCSQIGTILLGDDEHLEDGVGPTDTEKVSGSDLSDKDYESVSDYYENCSLEDCNSEEYATTTDDDNQTNNENDKTQYTEANHENDGNHNNVSNSDIDCRMDNKNEKGNKGNASTDKMNCFDYDICADVSKLSSNSHVTNITDSKTVNTLISIESNIVDCTPDNIAIPYSIGFKDKEGIIVYRKKGLVENKKLDVMETESDDKDNQEIMQIVIQIEIDGGFIKFDDDKCTDVSEQLSDGGEINTLDSNLNKNSKVAPSDGENGHPENNNVPDIKPTDINDHSNKSIIQVDHINRESCQNNQRNVQLVITIQLLGDCTDDDDDQQDIDKSRTGESEELKILDGTDSKIDAVDDTVKVLKLCNYSSDSTEALIKFLKEAKRRRCMPTTECDSENVSILKYKSVCPEDLPLINEEDLEYDENKLVCINWKKVKSYLKEARPSRKLKLLQALRFRLSHENPNVQEKSARDIVEHDLFDLNQLCCEKTLLDILLWPPIVSLPHPVQNGVARLFNALISQDIGRDYLNHVSIIETLTWGRSLRSILDHSEHTTVDIHTGNMLISIMMKLSLIQFQRRDMVRKGLIKWVIVHFEDFEQANSYHLEYASALLMMLLTVPYSTKFVIDQTHQLFSFFIRILQEPCNTSWPYIRLAMLALFRNQCISSIVKQSKLPQMLCKYLSETSDETEKQRIVDVLDQLKNPASTSIRKITQQATALAEEKLHIDEEINESDPVNCLPDPAGEELLSYFFSTTNFF